MLDILTKDIPMKCIILFMMIASIVGAEPEKSTILIEDLCSPVKIKSEFDGINSEINLFGYDNDRIRFIVNKSMNPDQSIKGTVYSVVVDHESECFKAEIKNGDIVGIGDKEIMCKKLKDNTKFYPYVYDAYLIYSKKYNFVFPIVNKKEMFGYYSDDMINYFVNKYLK